MHKLIGLFLLMLSFCTLAIDLSPIKSQDWTYENVRHLLLRSGFGATPEKIETLLKSSPLKLFTKSSTPNKKNINNLLNPEFLILA